MEEIRASVQERTKGFGVEIVDVRLKRVDFAPEISESVYRRMEAERKRVANEQRSIGSAEGEKIRADADRQKEVLLSAAYRDAQKIRGDGDAQASALYAQSFGQNAEFARFYRSLEAYRSSFRNRNDVMVVDPSSEFFKYMKSPDNRAGCAPLMLETFALAVGLMLVLEGLLPLLAPATWRQMFQRVTELNDGQIRFFGLIAVAAGSGF